MNAAVRTSPRASAVTGADTARMAKAIRARPSPITNELTNAWLSPLSTAF